MKKIIIIIILSLLCLLTACKSDKNQVITEEMYFRVMTNILYYPEQYEGKTLELDCFTYELEDVDGNKYLCGVRKCSSGVGCKCGRDTIIGFILKSEQELPSPKNQNIETNDKMWIHIKGSLNSMRAKEIRIYAWNGDKVDYNKIETVNFYVFEVESFSVVEDYSKLAYYVTQ